MVQSNLTKEEIGKTRVLIRGAGEMASGVAHRLFTSGFRICLTEISRPLAVRRLVSFSEAVYDGEKTVEEVTAIRISQPAEIFLAWEERKIPLLVDPDNQVKAMLRAQVLIDAILAKKNVGTAITDAPLVIGLGPGFTAQQDVHVVIETNRGPNLGKLIYDGEAEPNTGVPGIVGGYGKERVIRASCQGTLTVVKDMGTIVAQGEIVARVAGESVKAGIPGIVRGMLRDGTHVVKGLKLGDIDPRCDLAYCTTISDKAKALGDAALEAILTLLPQKVSREKS